MGNNLGDPDLLPDIKTNANIDEIMRIQSPAQLLDFVPVMEAEHDGEGGGGQLLLLVVVVKTVSCCQGKSVANLWGNSSHNKTFNIEWCNAIIGDTTHTNTALHWLFMQPS